MKKKTFQFTIDVDNFYQLNHRQRMNYYRIPGVYEALPLLPSECNRFAMQVITELVEGANVDVHSICGAIKDRPFSFFAQTMQGLSFEKNTQILDLLLADCDYMQKISARAWVTLVEFDDSLFCKCPIKQDVASLLTYTSKTNILRNCGKSHEILLAIRPHVQLLAAHSYALVARINPYVLAICPDKIFNDVIDRLKNTTTDVEGVLKEIYTFKLIYM